MVNLDTIQNDNSDRSFSQVTVSITADQIARRAYDLYEHRQRQDGHDVDDWLQAERELYQMHPQWPEGSSLAPAVRE